MRFFIVFKILENILKANSGDPGQMSRSVASDLGLHCLPLSHKKDVRLIWVDSFNLWDTLIYNAAKPTYSNTTVNMHAEHSSSEIPH